MYVCVCVSVHVHVCMNVYVHVYVHVHAYMCMSVLCALHVHVNAYAYLPQGLSPYRDLFKALVSLVRILKLSTWSEPTNHGRQLPESIPMYFPPGWLSALQSCGERVVRADELVRGPGKGCAGRTGLLGRAPPPEEGSNGGM